MTVSEYRIDANFDDLVAAQVIGIYSYEEIENFPNVVLEEDRLSELRIIPKSEGVVLVQFPKRFGFYNPEFIRICTEEFMITHWQILHSTKARICKNILVGHIKDNDYAVLIAPKADPRTLEGMK